MNYKTEAKILKYNKLPKVGQVFINIENGKNGEEYEAFKLVSIEGDTAIIEDSFVDLDEIPEKKWQKMISMGVYMKLIRTVNEAEVDAWEAAQPDELDNLPREEEEDE